jgi:hypothetical protein
MAMSHMCVAYFVWREYVGTDVLHDRLKQLTNFRSRYETQRNAASRFDHSRQ